LREHRDALGGLGGEKICFSPPPPFNMTEGSRWGAYRDTGITEAYGDAGTMEKD